MRSVLVGITLACAACAAIAGLEDPNPPTASGALDASPPDANDDGGGSIDGRADAPSDAADAGHVCTGTVLKQDDFTNRPDAQDDWMPDSKGSGTLLEIVDNRLHAVVPAVPEAGVNVRAEMGVTKTGVKRMCAELTVQQVKPTSTAGYDNAGNTTFSFIGAQGVDGGSAYHGILIKPSSVYAYALHVGATTSEQYQSLNVPIVGTWRVVIRADYVSDQVTIRVNDQVQTITGIRPSALPTATFYVGIRNFGTTPAAEAFFDDVYVTAE